MEFSNARSLARDWFWSSKDLVHTYVTVSTLDSVISDVFGDICGTVQVVSTDASLQDICPRLRLVDAKTKHGDVITRVHAKLGIYIEMRVLRHYVQR